MIKYTARTKQQVDEEEPFVGQHGGGRYWYYKKLLPSGSNLS